jgi:flavin-dependent dehydrogenase
MYEYVDVAILGGGPAGCAAALTIKKLNPQLNVTIIEEHTEPTHKIGEILLTQTMIMLDHIGISEEIAKYAKKFNWQKKFGVTFVMGKSRKPWQILNNSSVILTNEDDTKYPNVLVANYNYTPIRHTFNVKRHEFDYALREIAQKNGVNIEKSKIIKINIIGTDENSTIKNVLLNNQKKIFAKHFLDCSGQSALVARELKSRQPILDSFMGKRLSSRYAYFKDVDFTNAIKFEFLKQGANILAFDGGWAWIAAVEDNDNPLTSIGVVSDNWKNETLYSKLQSLPEFKLFGLDKSIQQPLSHLGEEQDLTFSYGAPDYSNFSSIPYGTNWALIGDSSIFIDPLLSQGVTLAISYGYLYGKTLVDCFDDDAESVLMSYANTYKKYLIEKNVIVKLLEFWYNPENMNNDSPTPEWIELGKRLSKIFKRDLSNNIQDFQFIINLENIHMLAEDISKERIAELIAETS